MHKRVHFMAHQAVGSEFRSRWLCAVVAAAIVGLTAVRGVSAAEPAATPVKPIGAAGMAPAQTPAPLRGVMRLDPSKFGARAASGPAVSVTSIQAACGAVDPSRYVQLLRTIQNKENLCAAATYSVEDQRAAGCSSADTMDQCQTKLYSYCMDRSGDRVAFKNAAEQELTVARRARDMLDGHMRYIENTRAAHSGEPETGPSRLEWPEVKLPLPIR